MWAAADRNSHTLRRLGYLVRGLRAVLVAGGVCLSLATPALGHVELSTTPGLVPGFRRAATDYVSRCSAREPLQVHVQASEGDQVSVAGRKYRGRSFTAAVLRATGQSLTVKVHAPDGSVRRYYIRCLPRSFPNWSIRRHGNPQAQWYVTAPVTGLPGGYVAIFDSYGAPVWWWHATSSDYFPWDAKLLDNGVLAWGENFGSHFGWHSKAAYEVRRLDGRLIRLIRTSGHPTDVHDLEEMSNGDVLALTYARRDNVDLSAYGGERHATVFDAEIQEITPRGKVVWRWNSRKHVSPSETSRRWWYDPARADEHPPAERGYDLLHVNSVQPDGDGIIVSARALDAIFRIDRATGKIDWKLGGSYVPGESLTVLRDASQPLLGGQHDARVWPDGTVSVYDNRSYTSGRPNAERFRIDPITRTATLIGRITEPNVPVSLCCGSARRLAAGDWVICWGATGFITEQTPSGAVVLELHLGSNTESYRAQPIPPGRLAASSLRRGMDRMAAPP